MERGTTSVEESEEILPLDVPSSSLKNKLRLIRNSSCELCSLHEGASTVCVPGEGSGRLPVLILGEAPGREEDKRGRPFCGPSGKLLRSELLKAGLPLKKCYITNTVKCYPKGTPTDEQRDICSQNYLRKEIQLLSPKYILAVGGTALSAVFPGHKISEIRGTLNDSWLNEGFVFPIWHPAYILRNRSKIEEWRIDIENFVALVEVDHGLE